MVCTSLCSLLHPLFYFLCSILYHSIVNWSTIASVNPNIAITDAVEWDG